MTAGPGSCALVQNWPVVMSASFTRKSEKPHVHGGNHGNPFLRPDLPRQNELSSSLLNVDLTKERHARERARPHLHPRCSAQEH